MLDSEIILVVEDGDRLVVLDVGGILLAVLVNGDGRKVNLLIHLRNFSSKGSHID